MRSVSIWSHRLPQTAVDAKGNSTYGTDLMPPVRETSYSLFVIPHTCAQQWYNIVSRGVSKARTSKRDLVNKSFLSCRFPDTSALTPAVMSFSNTGRSLVLLGLVAATVSEVRVCSAAVVFDMMEIMTVEVMTVGLPRYEMHRV